jgi:hypothetical protein
MAVQAEHEEMIEFIELHRLMGKGLGSPIGFSNAYRCSTVDP